MVLDTLSRVAAWLWPVLAWLATGLLVVLLRSKTPAQWIALGEKRPRIQGAIRMLRGLGLDPAKVVDGLVQFLTGRVRPLAAERLSPEQRRMLERARNALIAVSVAERSDEDREALARLDELLGGAAPDAAPPRANGGFAEATVLRWIAAVALAALGALWLSGCPMPPPDGCPPRATRCSPSGVPQVCTLGQYWSAPRPETPCAAGSVCCYTRSPYGRELHACVPQGACLPEPPPPNDAGLEGGAL
jgi:hypothetical protein